MYKNKIQYSINSSDANAIKLTNEIKVQLKNHKAKNIEDFGNWITFGGGIFRLVLSGNILNPITKGEIKVDKSDFVLEYSLSFKQLLFLGIIATIIFIGIVFLSKAPNIAFIIFPLLVWCWLVGMNFFLGIYRFRNLMKRCIKKSGYKIEN